LGKKENGLQGGRMAPPLVRIVAPIMPAIISLSHESLTVEANNSDLTEILHTLAAASGMTISGLKGGPRIFGQYGPGNSRAVLASLLIGVGYNFIMVGAASEGMPRELSLTMEATGASAPGTLFPGLGADSEESGTPGPNESPSAGIVLGPGAIPPAPSLDDVDDKTRVSQTLQRLSHMQEQPQNAPE